MALKLSPEVENAIRERAIAEGLSVNDLLARTFASDKTPTPPASDPTEHVRVLLRQWQAQDNTPLMPPIHTRPGETPTQALFRKWEEEDASMTPVKQPQVLYGAWKDKMPADFDINAALQEIR